MQRLFGLFWFLFQLTLLVGFIIFAASNYRSVPIRFWPFEQAILMAPWVLLLGGVMIGFSLSALVTGWLRLRGFTKRRAVERQQKHLQTRVADLSEEAGALRTKVKNETISDTVASLEGHIRDHTHAPQSAGAGASALPTPVNDPRPTGRQSPVRQQSIAEAAADAMAQQVKTDTPQTPVTPNLKPEQQTAQKPEKTGRPGDRLTIPPEERNKFTGMPDHAIHLEEFDASKP